MDFNIHQRKGLRMPINFTFGRLTIFRHYLPPWNGHRKHDPANIFPLKKVLLLLVKMTQILISRSLLWQRLKRFQNDEHAETVCERLIIWKERNFPEEKMIKTARILHQSRKLWVIKSCDLRNPLSFHRTRKFNILFPK